MLYQDKSIVCTCIHIRGRLMKLKTNILLIAFVFSFVLLFSSCMYQGEDDAKVINTRWSLNGYHATEDTALLLDEKMKTEYVLDDGSQVINYYVFDIKDADISNIPFENTTDWENDDQIMDFYSLLNVPEEKRPQKVDKVYRITESGDYPAYIWLFLSTDDNRMYVMEVLH